MGRAGQWGVALALAGALVWTGCGGGDDTGVTPEERPIVVPEAGQPDAGAPDAGQPDAGKPDAGQPDAGQPDAGQPDAGPQPLPAQTYPSLSGWSFYGPEAGGPNEPLDVAADEGGNIWVAGGEDGLFLLRKTGDGYATRFERFTMADGLRPYGYMKDGSAPPGTPYLKVLSVAGGPAGTVFVGYAGKPKPVTRPDGTRDEGLNACESEADYDKVNQVIRGDPSIYKSGDADRVTLTATGIKVVHYDISSGPGVVSDYPGREKVCNIYRIAYDPGTQSVWFGGNHAFARGEANYAGNPTCNGQLACSGVLEHVHPHVADENCTPLTDAYYGIAPLPNGDVWFGGANRSVKFLYGTYSGNYWRAQTETEDFPYHQNRIDIWTDPFYEVRPDGGQTCYTKAMKVDDFVSGMALTVDGRVFASSFVWGLRELNSSGALLRDHSQRLFSYKAAKGEAQTNTVAIDPSTDELWVGYRWTGSLSRMSQSGTGARHFYQELGKLGDHPVNRISMLGTGSSRRVLVAFGARMDANWVGKDTAGALGIYTGP